MSKLRIFTLSRAAVSAFILCGFWGIICVLWPFSAICQSAPATDEIIQTESGQHLFVHAPDGTRLSGWLYNRGVGQELVICYPGNACNASVYHHLAERDNSRSYLLFNYRGYGSSEGCAGEKVMREDASALLEQYRQQLNPKSIILVGFSLGTCVAIFTAEAHPESVNKLILICPFDSMKNLVAPRPGMRRWRCSNCFDVRAAAENISCETFVFIARQDEVVSMERTNALLRHFKQSVHMKLFPSGHSDILRIPELEECILRAMEAETSSLN